MEANGKRDANAAVDGGFGRSGLARSPTIANSTFPNAWRNSADALFWSRREFLACGEPVPMPLPLYRGLVGKGSRQFGSTRETGTREASCGSRTLLK